ncbi:MAG: FG-GAP-like repeat-containing protein [Thermoplasmatota archaeon]
MRTTVVASLLLSASLVAMSLPGVAQSGLHVIQYEDVTEAAGLGDFNLAGEIHPESGHNGITYPAFPEIMGSGGCFFDYDGDGYEDIYLVNQYYNPENPYSDPWRHLMDPHNKLYRNNGDGTFEDVSAQSGTDSRAFGYGCTAADYDADGDLDLYLANFGDNELLRNNGDGTFTDVTAAAGVAKGDQAGCGVDPCMSILSAWADYDLDGDLDFFVGNYVQTNFEELTRGPEHHGSQLNWLFRNNGDGTFTEVGEQAGVEGIMAEPTQHLRSDTLGALWSDMDLDGDLDLYVANDLTPNEFYVNNGDGTFSDHSISSGLDDDRAGMGVASGDFDRDGYPDLYFTHYQNQFNGFYRNNGDLTFEDWSGYGDLQVETPFVGWGTAFVDLDRDGDLDIVAANGHTESATPDYEQETLVFYNVPDALGPGGRGFVDVTAESGPGITAEKVTRGAAFADYDLDGDTDILLVNNNNDTVQLLRGSGVTNQWLSVLLDGDAPNTFGIGARVLATTGTITQVLELQAGSSYESQNSMRLDFGLGDATVVDKLTIHWPDGLMTETLDIAAGQAIRVDRTGSYVTDTLSPATTLVTDITAGVESWYPGPVDVTLDTVDRNVGAPSGVAWVEASVDGGAWAPYNGETLSFASEGTYTIQCKSADMVGNLEPVRSQTFGVDLTPPTASHHLDQVPTFGSWYAGDVTVTLEGSDALSGLHELRYRSNGGPWMVYEGPFQVSEAGSTVIDYYALDKAGHQSALGTVEVLVDLERPQADLERPNEGELHLAGRVLDWPQGGRMVVVASPTGMPGSKLLVKVDVEDDHSGIDRVAFYIDNDLQHTAYGAGTHTWHWQVSEAEAGNQKLRVVAYDNVGNQATRAVSTTVLPGALPL